MPKYLDSSCRLSVRLLLAGLFTSLLTLNAHAQAPAGNPGKPAGDAAAGAASGSSEAATRLYATAVQLQNRDQFDLAAEEWTKFVAKQGADPLAPRARHYLGVCQLKLKQYADAAATFQKLLDDAAKFPAGALVAETTDGEKLDLLPATYYYLGLSQYNVGQSGKADMLDRAQQTLATLAQKYPQGRYLPQAIFYQGEAAYAAGRKTDAVKFYIEFVKQFPDDTLAPDAWYALGVTQAELERFQPAADNFAAFLQLYPQHRLVTEVTMRRGDALMQLDKPAEAEPLFATAAAAQGFGPADYALRRQADARFEQKQYAKAASLYRDLINRYPQSSSVPTARMTAGKCLFLDDKFADARVEFEPLAAGDSDASWEAVHWITRAYLREGQPAKAAERVDAALKKAGKSTWAARLMLDRADALYEMPARLADASTAYNAVAEQHAQHDLAAEALYMASFCALKQNDYSAAASRSQKFLKQYPQHELVPAVRYVSAESKLLARDFKGAEADYGKLLRDYPQHAEVPTWSLRRGLALSLGERYSDAVSALKPLAGKLATADANAQAYYLLGNSYLQQKKPKEAAEALEASLAAAPQSKQADETLLLLAQIARDKNDLKRARAMLQRGMQEFSSGPVADKLYFRAAEYAYAADDLPAAVQHYQELLKRFGNSPLAPQARYGLGWALFSQGNGKDAVAAYDQLLAAKPVADVAARTLYARGVARYSLKDYQRAIGDFQAFLDTKPTTAERSDARYNLGLCLVAAEQLPAAIDTFQKLLKDDAKYVGADRAWNELAWAAKNAGREKDSLDAFQQLVKKFPDSPLFAEAQCQLADHYYQAEEFSRAAEAYASALTRAGESSLTESILHRLGWSYFRQGDYEKARATFQKQRQQFAKGDLSADAAFMEAETFFKQDQFEQALALYAKVQEPKAPGMKVLSLLHTGQAAAKLKQWKQSLQSVQAGLALDPRGPYAPELLYEQAVAEQSLDKPADALKHFEEVTELTGDEVAARARFMMGEIHFERREHQQAIKNYFRVLTYDSPRWQAAAHYETGRCFEVLKQPDQARRSYRELVEKFPNSEQAKLAQDRLKELGNAN
ncbi:MAG: tetratricopeptide repeat protein [Planctomycetes bacterium]|nr:tetratricopeptide repeat protein [Planctomycetota bacterium]